LLLFEALIIKQVFACTAMQWLVLKIKNYHLYENKKPDRFCSRLARVAVCGSY